MSAVALPYISSENKLNRLASMSSEPWFILLDSGGNDNQFNRYDIIVTKPTVTFDFQQHSIQIKSYWQNPDLKCPSTTELNLTEQIAQDPMAYMRAILDYYQRKAASSISSKHEGLPFSGGWMGYISYDFGRQLEKLPDLTNDEINLPWIKMGLYQWALITDHQQQTTRLYNFGLPDSEWNEVQVLVTECVASEFLASNFRITQAWQSNVSREEYAAAFKKAKDYIYAGDCYQVNYAQQFKCQYQGNVFDAYQALSYANKAPFSAYMNVDDHEILSLSPERFIECHQRQVLTQPIKGTRPRSDNQEEDVQLGKELVNSEKDKAENLMIVDLLRNDLSRTAAKGSVKVTELFGHYRFQSVHHLISTIESKLAPQYDCFDLLSTTLPGGSITGAPKIRAMEIIEELEKVKRNIYCGIIGYIDFNGNMDTNICIRTLVAKDNQLYCWAGGGLVADSELEPEYQETFDKLRKILPVLSSKFSEKSDQQLGNKQ